MKTIEKDLELTLPEAANALREEASKSNNKIKMLLGDDRRPRARIQMPRYDVFETTLDPVLSGVAWQDEFKMGMGVNAVTGETTASAVKQFTPLKSDTKTSSESYQFIENQSESNMEIGAALSGRYNINGATVSASFEYLKKIEYSELTITLLASYESTCAEYDEVKTYGLTDEAKKLLSENPTKFREHYGDYFIAGGKRSSRFVAVYTCKATSLKDMTSFKASLGGEAPDVFKVDGSASLMQSANNNNITIKYYVFMEGYDGTPPTTDDVIKKLEWFKNHESGIYLRAKLHLYNTIDSLAPKVVPISPTAFADLRLLYTSLWSMRARYASCPVAYQSIYTKEFVSIESEIEALEGQFTKNNELRLAARLKIDALADKLDQVYNRMDFYFRVLSEIGNEVPIDEYIQQVEGRTGWNYGFTSSSSPGVNINSLRKNVVVPTKFLGYGEVLASFERDPTKLIVGWRIISQWPKNNGWWKKISPQILLKDQAEFIFCAEFTTWAEWAVEIFTVDKSQYDFS